VDKETRTRTGKKDGLKVPGRRKRSLARSRFSDLGRNDDAAADAEETHDHRALLRNYHELLQ